MPRKDSKIKKVSSEDVAVMANASPEDVKAADVTSTKVSSEKKASPTKTEEFFFMKLSKEVREALYKCTLQTEDGFPMEYNDLLKNLGGLANEGLIPVSDEKKDGKRILNADMPEAKMALSRWSEYLKTRPVYQSVAYEELDTLKGKIVNYQALNEDLVIDMDDLLGEAKATFRALFFKGAKDYRPALSLVLAAERKLEALASEHIFSDVDRMFKSVHDVLEGQMRSDFKARIKRGKAALTSNDQKNAAIAIRKDLEMIVKLEEMPEASFSKPRPYGDNRRSDSRRFDDRHRPRR